MGWREKKITRLRIDLATPRCGCPVDYWSNALPTELSRKLIKYCVNDSIVHKQLSARQELPL